jgi:hypothetical protein
LIKFRSRHHLQRDGDQTRIVFQPANSRLPSSATVKTIIDGIVYGLLIAGTFGWVWPR